MSADIPTLVFDAPKDHRPYPGMNLDELKLLNQQASHLSPEDLTLALLRNQEELALSKFITADPAMIEMKSRVEKINSLPYNKTSPVLITGPSGTGKEIIAKSFKQSNQPFVARNCAAFPKDLIASLLFGHLKGTFTGASDDRHGIFVQAKHGVVFLDEIAELPLEAQAILLRVLQERTVCRLGAVEEIEINCRVIAATKYDLRERVENHLFREDLFARLMTFEIHITSLLERPGDIPLIAEKGLDMSGNALNYLAPILLYDPDTSQPTPLFRDIQRFNVRALQAYVARMRTYGSY